MDIKAASTYFDDDPVYDGYTGAFLFKAQVAAFDDSTSDGATNRRRVLSIGTGITIPTRRVVRLYENRWLVGVDTPDGFKGEVVRVHHAMKRATDLVSILTPGQLLTNAAGTSAYVHKHYFKDTADALTSAEMFTFWNIFVAPGEPAARGSFFKDASNRVYRCHQEYLPSEGLRVCQCDTLESDALQSVVWGTGSYDPVNDTVGAGSTTVNAVQFEVPRFYRFRHLSDPSYQKGDCAVFVPTTVTPKAGDTFTMLGKSWRALSVQQELDAWAVHARLV